MAAQRQEMERLDRENKAKHAEKEKMLKAQLEAIEGAKRKLQADQQQVYMAQQHAAHAHPQTYNAAQQANGAAYGQQQQQQQWGSQPQSQPQPQQAAQSQGSWNGNQQTLGWNAMNPNAPAWNQQTQG